MFTEYLLVQYVCTVFSILIALPYYSYDSESVSTDKLAASTTGFTGADIENMVNQAALRAALLGEESVNLEHLWYSLLYIILNLLI